MLFTRYKLLSLLQNNHGITCLILRVNEIDAEGVEILAESSSLKNIKKLDLYNNKIGDKGAIALAKSPHLKNLKELNLFENDIGDEGVVALAESSSLKNIEKLELWGNKVGDKGAIALAKSPHLKNLKELDLGRNKIGDKCAIALAKSPHLKNLEKFILRMNSIGPAGEEVLAEACNLSDGLNFPFYTLLLKARFESDTADKLDANSVKRMVFNSMGYIYYREEIINYILKQPNKYPFLINSKDEQGHTLSHFYTHSPEMQKFLFEHGMIPEQERDQRRDDARIVQDSQSVHASPIVKRINFFTKKLVESTKASEEQLKQAAASYVESIGLLKQYQNDSIKLRLLSSTDNEKGSVMKKTLRETDPIPGDEEFIKTVIDKAEQALKQQYLKKNFHGEYDEGYPTNRMQYDYARDDAKITIPESIGYIKLLIDRFRIPLKERKELLVIPILTAQQTDRQ